MFGKAAAAITARLLDHPDEKITDVSQFRTKGLKASNEKILAAVDGKICIEQAEKLRIIRSHMDNLKLCKANLESLILSTAEKYLPQIKLIITVPGIQSFAAIGILSEIGADMSVFPCSKHYARGLVLHRRIMKMPERRKRQESAEPVHMSNLCLYSVQSERKAIRKFVDVI